MDDFQSMNVLIACEFSGVVRDAFLTRGHNAVSCDLLATESTNRDPDLHFRGDVLALLEEYPEQSLDLIIAHPECTRLALSGARWYKVPPPGKTLLQMEAEFLQGVAFYRTLREKAQRCAKRVAIENPVMLARARDAIGIRERHIIQPWHFGESALKATGFELYNLPPLKPTKIFTKPRQGTQEYKRWTAVHRAAPGPDRWKERSRTFPGIAAAMADQWGKLA